VQQHPKSGVSHHGETEIDAPLIGLQVLGPIESLRVQSPGVIAGDRKSPAFVRLPEEEWFHRAGRRPTGTRQIIEMSVFSHRDISTK